MRSARPPGRASARFRRSETSGLMALFYPGFVSPGAANHLPPSQETQDRLTATSAHGWRKATSFDFAQAGFLAKNARNGALGFICLQATASNQPPLGPRSR